MADESANNTSDSSSIQVRYRDLDFWRGFACLSVIGYHSVLVNKSYQGASQAEWKSAECAIEVLMWGWIGVPLFFVISGYCISAAVARHPEEGDSRFSLAQRFFIRRFRRIFPPYLCLLCISVIAVGAIDYLFIPGLLSSEPRSQLRPWWLDWSQWLGNITLTESWREHLFGRSHSHFVGQSSTLCYEEQFYAIAGLSLIASRRWFFSLQGLITAFVLMFVFTQPLTGLEASGLFWNGYWLMFALGVLVYHCCNVAKGIQQVISIALIVVGFGVAFWPSLALPRGQAIAACFAALLIGLKRYDGILSDTRFLFPIQLCGAMCYSLYLVHGLLVDLVAKALYIHGCRDALSTVTVVVPSCLSISICFGWLFYVMIERRFLNSAGQAAVGSPLVLATAHGNANRGS